jgi:molecular chaperone DnaK
MRARPSASQPPPIPPPPSALPPPAPGATGPQPAIGRMPLAKAAVPRAASPQLKELVPAERKEFSGLNVIEEGDGEFGGDTNVATNERTFTREPPTTPAGGPHGLLDLGAIESGPDEATLGPTAVPALPGGRPAPALPRPVLLDVTPRALCVATVGGYCDEIIKRNSQIPNEQTRVFTTAVDGQRSVEIKVGQGESRRFEENVLLGTLILDGLEPKPRGTLRIAVTFEIDTDGILQVRAVDEHTQRQQSARIQLLGVIGDTDVAAARDKIKDLRPR